MPDWTDETSLITPHFTVRDALWLHAWQRLATEKDGVQLARILTLCDKLELVREALGGAPMLITSMYRSPLYNREQNINPVNDVHSMSLAADFTCSGMCVPEVQDRLRPQLATLGIRMERGTPAWVHVDVRLPGPSGREFVA